MGNKAENLINTPQELVLEDISHGEIPEDFRDPDMLLGYITTKLSKLYQSKKSNRMEFEDFLQSELEKHGRGVEEIVYLSIENDTVSLEDINGESIFSFSAQDFEAYILRSRYGSDRVSIEKRVGEIEEAIQSIYNDNDGYIFDGEIDENDRVKEGPYTGKNLGELRELLESDTQALAEIYEIIGKTQERRNMLRSQIEMLAGVGDLYEGGARVLSLSEADINKRVKEHITGMSIEDILREMTYFHEKINSNWRKSDMVRQVNLKLMNAFYTQTYEKLLKEKAPNSDVIRFVEIMTGRALIETEAKGRNGGRDKKTYRRISFDNAMANYDIASKSLLYIMHRQGGVLDTIIKQKQELAPGDPGVEDKNPKTLVTNFINTLEKRNPEVENFGRDTLIKAGFYFLIDLKEINYHALDFEQKVAIGAVYRMTKILDTLGNGEINTQTLYNEILKTSQQAFIALEDDINDTFDGINLNLSIAHPNFFGYSSGDLGLTGEMAQIFDLYQDIHGNSGFFDLHDENKDWFQEPSNVVTLGVGIIASIIILPALAPAGVLAMAQAGAMIGLATGVSSSLTSRQGYDTYDEAILDTSLQIFYEVVSSAVFMGAFGGVLKKAGMLTPDGKLRFDYDMLLSKEAWSTGGVLDKSFILAEVFSGMFANKVIIDYVKSLFPENNFDTNTQKYSDIQGTGKIHTEVSSLGINNIGS